MDSNQHIFSKELAKKIFLLWSMGEMAFTILPIVVIIIVNVSYGNNLLDTFLLPDWSFASIILYGISILRLIQIKAEYQKSISYRLYSGTNLYIVCCILSAVILVLAVIRQQNGQNISPFFVGISQIILFIFAGFSVYVATAVKEKFLDIPNAVHNSPKDLRSY